MKIEEVSMRYRVSGCILVVLSIAVSAVLSSCTALGLRDLSVEELKQKYGKPEDKYFSYQGLQVRYRDEGTGPVVVLVHGVCSSLETWDGWVPSLKEHYRVIRMDMPGFGMTGAALDPDMYTAERYLEFMDVFLSSLHIERCSMAGNSLGAYMTWNYALLHPEKMDKIILIDPIGYHQRLPWMLDFASSPLVRPISRRMAPRFLCDMSVYQVYGDKSKVTEEAKQRYADYMMREGTKSAWVDIFIAMQKKNDSPDLSKGIPDIKTPTLIMWGKKDEWIPYELMSKWQKDLPSAQYISYESAGHTSMEEIPDITVKDAMEFLK